MDLPSPLLDLGTGAGFPGIPLKIMRPDLELDLCEGRRRRVEFLQAACRTLGLEGVTILPHRLGARTAVRTAGIICRAVGSVAAILDLARNCLPPGGEVFFMKGPALAEELKALPPPAGFRLRRVLRYTIPATPHRRTLAVFTATAGGTNDMPSIIPVHSPQNERFKRARRLLTARGIRKEGAALFAGRKIVPELIAGHADRIETCFVKGDLPPPPGLPPSLPVLALRPPLFTEIDPAGTGGPVLVVRTAGRLEPWRPAETTAVALLLPLQDPANLGAAIRLGAAFGVDQVVLLEEAASPFLSRSVRAAGPAVLRVPLRSGPSLRGLSPDVLPIVALDPDGTPLPAFSFPVRCAILAGTEGPGVPANLPAAARVRIPMDRRVESLNAVSALAVALYAYRLQHPLPAPPAPPATVAGRS